MSTIDQNDFARNLYDLYCTERWCTHWALNCGFLPRPGEVVWEPAAGLGHIVRVLQSRDFQVLATDVKNHGFPELDGEQDFFTVHECDPSIKMIVTNPPYEIKDVSGCTDCTAESFVRHAIGLMKPNKGAVLMLLRHEFDSAGGRTDLFEQAPFAAKMTLTRRPMWIDPVTNKTFVNAEGKRNSPRFPYAWYYWDWRYPTDALPQMHWLPKRERLA